MKIVVLGLTLSSSWGNGHATTYRALLRAMAARGHEILFLECDRPWYAQARDLASPDFCTLAFYDAVADLARFDDAIAEADAVIVGSYVPDGIDVARAVLARARGVRAFYDIDTPVTLAALEAGTCAYLSPDLVGQFDVYLSFTGGPTLRRLCREFGARAACALYCSVDEQEYRPVAAPMRWDLGYLGTYSADRQPALERLLIAPARLRPDLRFVVAGPQYPDTIDWPANVERIDHLGPADHAMFYSSARWTLNVTRADMVRAGYSPSVRLFEAAACGAPIISDAWPGLDTVLRVGSEIVVAASTDDVLATLALDEARRVAMARAGRTRVLAAHTAAHRAEELERCITAALRAPATEAA
jgi:spore maturation protein CgeB